MKEVFNNVNFDMRGDIDINMSVRRVEYYPYRTAILEGSIFVIDRDSDIGKSIEMGLNDAIDKQPDNHVVFGLGRDINTGSNMLYVQISDSKIRIGAAVREERW